ncbi:hypothetical protein POJ06DRAFT_129065 [Lipomyces tetrasporus]|uniref:Oxysterol-binding protein n=1 Tax=Lipomyces tetrasporus TaxID=54092 RepID=A0AAD7VRP8_9ASCO|nr:uncharacterized protein POJ06DRAFT_129065 [Lipomyces tetrasporus]KAJ8099146.1 hypothetical protein POJ06DRAFT_129065 [Lipomyces tetrasporus]
MTFLRSLATSKGDLSSITAPPFILSGTSLVEYSKFWAELPDLFVAPTMILDKEERALAVLKWFIATLKGQYTSRNEALGSEKKPLNPFLGEVFLGQWETETEGPTTLVSEQVSHHPPVTAYAIYNDVYGIELQGYNGQKATFATTTLNVRQVGHAVLYIKKFDEYYYITLPTLHIEGLFYGAPYVELEQKTLIQSSSGYWASIEYSGKGYFSGKKNTFKAKFYAPDEDSPLYTISGQWSGKSTIMNQAKKSESLFYDASEHNIVPLIVKPIEQQAEYESRRAWEKVAAAVQVMDYDTIHVEKSKIENQQRELRKKEREDGVEWQRRYFELIEDEGPLREVAELAGVEPDENVWRFKRQVFEESPDSKM